MKRALLALATIAILGGAATIADAQNLQVIQQRREAMQPRRPVYPEPDPLPLKPLG